MSGSEVSVDAIDRCLPQMQCARCGYEACRPYAEAVAAGIAGVTLCTPGGPALATRLAALVAPKVASEPTQADEFVPLRVAAIIERDCIGCTKCIQVCPVDAILGAAQQMHTVMTSLCTGCELCVPACPVDCIVLEAAPFVWDRAKAEGARTRYDARRARQTGADVVSRSVDEHALLREEIAAAVARVRVRRSTKG